MTTYPNCVMKFVKIEPQAMKSNSYRNNYIQYSMLSFLLSLHDFAILHISFEYNEKHRVTMSSQAGEHHFMAHGTPSFPIPPSPQCCSPSDETLTSHCLIFEVPATQDIHQHGQRYELRVQTLSRETNVQCFRQGHPDSPDLLQ